VLAAAAASLTASSPGSANGMPPRSWCRLVELSHLREAALEHFRIGERCNRFQLIRIDPFDELIHELAPRPEAVALQAAPLREPGDATLKRVAV